MMRLTQMESLLTGAVKSIRGLEGRTVAADRRKSSSSTSDEGGAGSSTSGCAALPAAQRAPPGMPPRAPQPVRAPSTPHTHACTRY